MAKTKISINALLGSGKRGFIELPQQITLCCPMCGTLVADKGRCLAKLIKIPDPRVRRGSGFLVELRINCRKCREDSLGPAIF